MYASPCPDVHDLAYCCLATLFRLQKNWKSNPPGGERDYYLNQWEIKMLGKTGNKGSVGRNRFRKKADQLRKLRGAIPIETLEPRRLLSVSAATILGPFTTASGGVWTYTVTASGNGVSASGTATRTNVGPATAPSGNSAIEQDLSTTETASNGATLTTSNQDYYAMTGAGLVQYAEVGIGKDTTGADIFTPP